jgi:excisionase family DNA binding protein
MDAALATNGSVEGDKGRRYLTLRQAAVYLGMSSTTLYRLTYRMTDRLPFYKVGKLKLFRVEDVDQWMDRHRIEDRPAGW